MNLSLNVLKRHIDIQQTPVELRHLLDDIGIEVKRMEEVEDDIVYGLELLANRGDHHSYVGIARDIYNQLCHRCPLLATAASGSRNKITRGTQRPEEVLGICW